MAGDDVTGWKVDQADRQRLLGALAPTYAAIDADHVTLKMHAGPDDPLPPPATAEIVGEANDGAGVQAMVVRIDGSTNRPGGGTYHITWSLEPGRRAIESNDVITARGWTPLAAPLPVRLHPARFS